jgi:hypothetical protein
MDGANLRESQRVTRLERLALRLDLVFFLLLMVGAYAAVFRWRPAAALMLTGLMGHLLVHVTVGVSAHWRIMRAPWPKITPLDDDDD